MITIYKYGINKKIKSSLLLFSICIFVLFTNVSFSKDLGVYGQTYPIIEQDFLEFLKTRLVEMQQNGEWQKIQDDFKNNVSKHAERPTPLTQITKATKTRSWLYDPSLTVPYDLRDHNGSVFVKAGTVVNPLQFMSLHKAFIFIDGDDKKQIEWVRKIDSSLLGKIKIILVSGSILLTEKLLSKTIYFDQQGRLVQRFSIEHVPAMIQQDGLKLKITEYAL